MTPEKFQGQKTRSLLVHYGYVVVRATDNQFEGYQNNWSDSLAEAHIYYSKRDAQISAENWHHSCFILPVTQELTITIKNWESQFSRTNKANDYGRRNCIFDSNNGEN